MMLTLPNWTAPFVGMVLVLTITALLVDLSLTARTSRRGRALLVILAIIIGALAVRLLLPSFVKSFLNY